MNHVPEDMTVTVDAATTLPALQAELAKRGQWLPVDPPGALTIAELLDHNASGPRRYAFGTARDHVLGLRVRLHDGRVIKCGGNVVKNVAGYDLCRLFTGAHSELGKILEATFKLRPLPEEERFVQHRCASLDEAGKLIEELLASEIMPVILDVISPAIVIVGFAGTQEEVAWQLGRVRPTEPATLDYNQPLPRHWSVLPSRLIETLKSLGNVPFVARAGNGVIYYQGGPVPPAQELPVKLLERVKAAL